MQIKMLKTMAGPEGAAREGQVIDCPKAVGYELIEAGAAQQVASPEAAKPKRRRAAKPRHAPESAAAAAAPETAADPDEAGAGDGADPAATSDPGVTGC